MATARNLNFLSSVMAISDEPLDVNACGHRPNSSYRLPLVHFIALNFKNVTPDV
jgi:hypothetical protein